MKAYDEKPSVEQKTATHKIPKKIHLFWTGSVLPDREVNNLLSFLNNLPDSEWKVYVWLTNFNDLFKARYFRDLPDNQLPSTLEVKNINELLEDSVIYQLIKKFPTNDGLFSFYRVKEIIRRELCGLGNFAASKDGLAHLIIFVLGGYFFDFDYKAVGMISEPRHAPLGFLVDYENFATGVAAERGSSFSADCLSFLVANYTLLPHTIEDETGFYKGHPSPLFFETQYIRDRSHGIHRTSLTLKTSGAIIANACQQLLDKKKAQHFPAHAFRLCTDFIHATESELAMGVKTHSDQDGNWRSKKKFRSFDDSTIKYHEPKERPDTLLHLACKEGNTDRVRQLLGPRESRHINTRTGDGITPLFLACQRGDEGIVRELIRHPELDVDKAVTNRGVSPLGIAIQQGHEDIVKLILQEELLCPVDMGQSQNNLLIQACESENTKNRPGIFRSLLAYNSLLIFERNDGEYMPIEVAFIYDNMTAISEILSYGREQGLDAKDFIPEGLFEWIENKSALVKSLPPDLYEYLTQALEPASCRPS